MSFLDFLTRDQRLVILKTLYELPQYTSNSSVIAGVMDAWGHKIGRDKVKTELRWLEEQGLVKLDVLGNDTVLVAVLTERGADVATGRAFNDGVKRPGA